MMTLLVTGGCGFIGSAFVRQRVAKGDTVIVLDAIETNIRGVFVLLNAAMAHWRGRSHFRYLQVSTDEVRSWCEAVTGKAVTA